MGGDVAADVQRGELSGPTQLDSDPQRVAPRGGCHAPVGALSSIVDAAPMVAARRTFSADGRRGEGDLLL